MLIIFDRLFGACIKEREDLACCHDLVHPIASYNPLGIEFAGWISSANDLLSAPSLTAKLGPLFRASGWTADGAGQATEDLRKLAS